MEGNAKDVRNWLRLVRCNGVGPTIFARLLEYFGSVDAVLSASAAGLAKVDGVGQKTAEHILRTRNSFDADKEIELAQKLGVVIINLEDERYPAALKKIYDPPPVLYIKGNLVKSDALAIGEFPGSQQDYRGTFACRYCRGSYASFRRAYNRQGRS